MAAPDSRLCRYAIYESGFAAFGIAFYSSQLYPEGEICLRRTMLSTLL